MTGIDEACAEPTYEGLKPCPDGGTSITRADPCGAYLRGIETGRYIVGRRGRWCVRSLPTRD